MLTFSALPGHRFRFSFSGLWLPSAVFLCLNLFFSTPAQEKSTVVVNPEGSRFMSLRANYDEARLGVLYFPVNGNLKVDIGNVMDLLYIPYESGSVSFAVEFMAYAYATNYREYRLQIDVIDGFFGGNAVFTFNSMPDSKIRFRFIHNSAHLVDGRFDTKTALWRNGELPKPYTRDFAELVYEYSAHSGSTKYRTYAGASYGVHIRPTDVQRAAALVGAEWYFTGMEGKFYNTTTLPFAAAQYSLTPAPKLRGGVQVQAGVKFGSMYGKGMCLYASYYNGPSYFHELYNEVIKRVGLGFSVDFP